MNLIRGFIIAQALCITMAICIIFIVCIIDDLRKK